MAKRTLQQAALLLAPGEELPGAEVTYLIKHVLGVGGYAAVYLAENGATGQPVALKEFARPREAAERELLRRLFEREREVGNLVGGHPLMPAVSDSFTHDGYQYLAQEMIEGTTLSDILIQHRALPARTAVRWGALLCDALAFLHGRGVVHHDLKPSNILITTRGYPILFDFGAARRVGEEDGPDVPTYGTSGFLAPELEDGSAPAADVRADIFALGAVLYTIVTGLPPDQDEINARTFDARRGLCPALPDQSPLVPIIARALALDVGERYPDAAAMAGDLRLVSPPVLLPSARRARFEEDGSGGAPAQAVTLSNVGGGALRGTAQPRAPWLRVEPSSYQGNGQQVTLRVDPDHLPPAGGWAAGQVEITNTADGAQDTWLLECLIHAAPRSGAVSVLRRELIGASGVPDARGKKRPLLLARQPSQTAATQRAPRAAPQRAAPARPAPQPPTRPAPPSPAVVPSLKGDPDIMPKATVIRLGVVLGAIILLAGYFLGRRHTAPVSGTALGVQGAPSAPASSEGATPSSTGGGMAALSAAGNLLRPTSDLKAWHMDLAWGGVGSLSVEDHVLHATVSRPGKKYWHVQFYQTPSGLREGQSYTLTFRARADSPCDMPVGGSVNFGDYHPIGLTTHFLLGRDWKTFSHTFVIHGMANDNNRIPIFMVGTKPHQYWLTDVVLRPAR